MSFIFAYITNSDKKIAKKIAMNLLKKRIVACANMFPIDSIYWWKNKIEESKEYVLIVKTKKEEFRKHFLSQRHFTLKQTALSLKEKL